LTDQLPHPFLPNSVRLSGQPFCLGATAKDGGNAVAGIKRALLNLGEERFAPALPRSHMDVVNDLAKQ
jgi:hypothetical protein